MEHKHIEDLMLVAPSPHIREEGKQVNNNICLCLFIRSTCAVMNTLHMAVAHKQRDIVELLLKSGYDPNVPGNLNNIIWTIIITQI